MDDEVAKYPMDIPRPSNMLSPEDNSEFDQENIDDFNDDTFGSGAVVDDWESAHQQLSGLCHKVDESSGTAATTQVNGNQGLKLYQHSGNRSVDNDDNLQGGYSPFSPTIWSSFDSKLPSWNNDNLREQNNLATLSGDSIIKSISQKPPDWHDKSKQKLTVEELEKEILKQRHDHETVSDSGMGNLNRLLQNAKILPTTPPSPARPSTLPQHDTAPPSSQFLQIGFTLLQGQPLGIRNVPPRFEIPNFPIPVNRPPYQRFPREFRQPFPHRPSMHPMPRMPPMPRPNFGRYQMPPNNNNKIMGHNTRWGPPNSPFMMHPHYNRHVRPPIHPHLYPIRSNLIRPRLRTEDRAKAFTAFDNIDLSGIGERLGILKHDESNSPDSLMTRKEKEWLLKIQLLQLNNQDPYVDDYYFQMYELKKLAKRLGVPITDDYKALLELSNQPPDTVSKLQSKDVDQHNHEMNVTANLVKPSTLDIKARKHDPVSFENTLGKIYSLLLTLDDFDREALCTDDESVKKEIDMKKDITINEMFEILKLKTTTGAPEKNDDDVLVQILMIQKGKTLISRLLRFLNQDQAFAIVGTISQNLPIIIKKDQIDKVLMVMKDAIQKVIVEMALANCIICAQNLLHGPINSQIRPGQSKVNPVAIAYKNEFGLIFLRLLVQRGNGCISNGEEDESLHLKWHDIVKSICNNLESIIAAEAVTKDRLALLDDIIKYCDEESCSKFISLVKSLEVHNG
ncbi:Protein PAT1-like protein 1 [Trichoplax sp. H2]|nr:Protein PAT1-like protein 1 [Trichoplax sp. H2]|eukprot:RDD43739.1 Protein PAT1-like protein 1 [Trichoplax sp. H2]